MIWLKRRLSGVDYEPYFHRLEKLLLANAINYQEYLMVSTKTDDPFTDDYYIGVPDGTPLHSFDGFVRVGENELPKEIDTFHLGDASKQPYTSRFRFRSDHR